MVVLRYVSNHIKSQDDVPLRTRKSSKMYVRVSNHNVEVLNIMAALYMTISTAKGLQDVLKSNLGPKRAIKMLVGGSRDINLTKDGNTLLKEMTVKKRETFVGVTDTHTEAEGSNDEDNNGEDKETSADDPPPQIPIALNHSPKL